MPGERFPHQPAGERQTRQGSGRERSLRRREAERPAAGRVELNGVRRKKKMNPSRMPISAVAAANARSVATIR